MTTTAINSAATPQANDDLFQALGLDQDEKSTVEFLNMLVSSMLGYSILDIPETQRLDLISQCVQIFSTYIENYVNIKFGKKESVRLKASQQFQTDVFSKFAELGDMFDEAYTSFVSMLENSWQTAGQAA